jgi:hypothetical protein
MTIVAKASDYVPEDQIVVLRPDPSKLAFVCIGRTIPDAKMCLFAINEFLRIEQEKEQEKEAAANICKRCGEPVPPSGRGHASVFNVIAASEGRDPWEYQCSPKEVPNGEG